MKNVRGILLLAMVLIICPARAQIPGLGSVLGGLGGLFGGGGVTAYVSTSQWAEQLAAHAADLRQAQQIFNETRQVVEQVDTVRRFIGDPKLALSDLHYLHSLGDTIESIAGEDGAEWARTMDNLASSVYSIEDMVWTGQEMYDDAMATGRRLRSNDRNVSFGQFLYATRDLADKTREMLEAQAREDMSSQERIDAAVDKLAKATTQVEIDRAMVELQREQALLTSIANRRAILLAQQEEARRIAAVQAAAERMVVEQSMAEDSRQLTDEQAQRVQEARAEAERQLKSVDAPINTYGAPGPI